MYSKEPFIQDLTNAPFYDVVRAWICKNYNPEELDLICQKHPDYRGSLLDYYIDQAAVICVEMKGFRPDEIYFRSRSVFFEEGREYVYRPLSPLPLLGALWGIIMADKCRWDEDTRKARLVMEEMERISTSETMVLRNAILENTPLVDDHNQNAKIIADEIECSLHPELLNKMQKHLAHSVAHPSNRHLASYSTAIFLWPSYAANAKVEDKQSFENIMRSLCQSKKRSRLRDIKNFLKKQASDGIIIRPEQINTEYEWVKLFGFQGALKTYYNC